MGNDELKKIIEKLAIKFDKPLAELAKEISDKKNVPIDTIVQTLVAEKYFGGISNIIRAIKGLTLYSITFNAIAILASTYILLFTSTEWYVSVMMLWFGIDGLKNNFANYTVMQIEQLYHENTEAFGEGISDIEDRTVCSDKNAEDKQNAINDIIKEVEKL